MSGLTGTDISGCRSARRLRNAEQRAHNRQAGLRIQRDGLFQ